MYALRILLIAGLSFAGSSSKELNLEQKEYIKAFEYLEEGHREEAKVRLEKIYLDASKFAEEKIRISSDIGGTVIEEESAGAYVYGSVGYNRMSPVLYALIDLEMKEFNYSKAMEYFELVTSKYQVQYTCGTGMMAQESRENDLLIKILDGLGNDPYTLDVLFKRKLLNSKDIVSVLNKVYGEQRVRLELERAMQNPIIKVDVDTTEYTYYEYNTEDLKRTEKFVKYLGKDVRLMIFNREVKLRLAQESREKGRVEVEDYLKTFKKTDLYCGYFECPKDLSSWSLTY